MNVAFSAIVPDLNDRPAPAGYTFEVRWQVSVSDEVESTPELVQRSVRLPAESDFTAHGLLEDVADGTSIIVSVLAPEGVIVVARTLVPQGGAAHWELNAAEVRAIVNARQQLPPPGDAPPATRQARFIHVGTVALDLGHARLLVAPVAQGTDRRGWPAPLRVEPGQVTSVEMTDQDLGGLGALTWFPVPVAVDGQFQFAVTPQNSDGWLWWLTGNVRATQTTPPSAAPRSILGFVPDDLSTSVRGTRAIALPVLSGERELHGDAADDHECECESKKRVPADVTETELANNPEVFSEDPGAFCKPFSNPERILSERAFQVIARVSQPEVGGRPSGRTRLQDLLIAPGDEISTVREESRGIISRVVDTITSRVTAPATIAVAATPQRVTMPPAYLRAVATLPEGRGVLNANRPLQWEDDIAQYQATSVAYGHLLEFRIRWRSNGYSLGTVAKTLTLAPRQTKRIQKIEWQRAERAARIERTQLRDELDQSTVRERDYQDQVSANLSEWASGGSSSSMAGIAAGIGFFASGILGGVGGGASTASSSSHQQGGRTTTASEQQRLRDAIRQHGDALRRLESTVVNEVTQEETVTGTTEVIRNANFAHSLTVIYYQILRHLKVNTEFAGVRECLFIPFAIKPFTIQRAYRWREAITAYIRERRFGRALRFLRDVATNFATSDVPPGPRARQRVTFLRGSIYLSLGIERPRDSGDSAFNAASWVPIQPFLGLPALGIYSALVPLSPAARDRAFQAEHAPRIAAEWTNALTLRLGGRTVKADFTLATRYQYNSVVRVDFVVPTSELAGVTRERLPHITIGHPTGLPPGSIANLRRATITYTTDRYERTVEGRSGVDDLVNPSSGVPDTATALLPLDSWEQVDERLEMRRAVNELIEHLNEHVEYYHKAIWWRMDRDRLMMMLDGFYVPGTNGVSIASVVDREPLGIIGNSLVYRVGAASFLGYGSVDAPEKLYNVYDDRRSLTQPLYVSLPTDGLYAQTIMDECAALEEHYGNTDWVLNDKEPELGTIDPSLMLTRRADQTGAVMPTTLPPTMINLHNAPEAPPPSGLQGVLNAVTSANAFRDMAGLAGTQANAQAAMTAAANLASTFGNQAAAIELAKLAKSAEATRTADQKLASIKNAVDKNLTTQQDAQTRATEVLRAMNPDAPKAQAPHENPTINRAIDRLPNVAGSMLTAATGEGSVALTVGGARPLFTNAAATSTIPEAPGTGSAGTNGVASALPAIQLLVNGSPDAASAYVAWAPRPCVLRSTNGTGGRVLVRNVPQAGGGQLVFLERPDSAPRDELLLDVPANGDVSFFTCGRYDRVAGIGFPSTNDRDTAIVVSTTDGATELARRDVMVRIRKNAETLTPGERDRFLTALMRLNEPGGIYPDFQNRHTSITDPEIHRRSSFLPWHRAFVLDLERQLQQIDPSVTLPYWRFDQPAPKVFTRDFMGTPDPGDPSGIVEFSPSNPLVNWRMHVLGTGTGRIDRTPIPPFDTATSRANITNDELATLGLGTEFVDGTPVGGFRSMERDPHGRAHTSFAGPISEIGLAPGDPLFFLLHANVDRLWAKWQWVTAPNRFDGTQPASYPRQGNGDPTRGGEPGIGNFTNDTMWPWNGATGAPRPPDAPGGPFPPSPVSSRPGQIPTVLQMIDYQGQNDLDRYLGYGYDDVPFDHPGEIII